jgi:hypothetical protein
MRRVTSHEPGDRTGSFSFRSPSSLLSAFSVGSILSFGSVLRIGSVGSVLSIGSVVSVLSIGGAGARPEPEKDER